MKSIANKIFNNKEVIIITLVFLYFIGLVIYNILTHGIKSI